jgi:hypothetical protein
MKHSIRFGLFATVALLLLSSDATLQERRNNLTFFITSAGPGKGPWQNAKEVVIARDVNELHGTNSLNKETALNEVISVNSYPGEYERSSPPLQAQLKKVGMNIKMR